MDECFKCGVSGNMACLYDAITSEGIKKICEKCSLGSGIPLIRKPTTHQLEEAERKQSVSQRISNLSNVSASQKDVTMRQLVDLKSDEQFANVKVSQRPDLIDNFHWTIMRVRRSRKLTQEQLANEIGESVEIIRMAEKGILPENDYIVIRKLEGCLRVHLLRKETENMLKTVPVSIAGTRSSMGNNLTIDELKRLKVEKEEHALHDASEQVSSFGTNSEDSILEKDEDTPEFDDELFEEKEEEDLGRKGFKERRELTQSEIDRLIFG